DDEIARDEVGGATVLVDARAGVELLRRHPGQRAVRLPTHEHLPPALLRPALDPPADPVDPVRLAEEDDAIGQPLDLEGRGPRPEWGSDHAAGGSSLLRRGHRQRSLTCRASTTRRTPPAPRSSARRSPRTPRASAGRPRRRS